VLLGEIDYQGRPLPRAEEHMNPDQILEDPSCRRVLHGLALRVRTRRVRRLQGGTDAVCSGSVHQQTYRHHPEERHDARGLLAIKRGSEQLGVFQKANAAFRMHLAFIARQKRLWRQWRSVECVGGQHATTVLVEAGVAGRERRGHSPRELVDQRRGWRPWSRAAPLAIAGPRVHRTGAQTRGLPGVCTERQRLLGIGFARKGSATSFLPRVELLSPGWASRLVDGALCPRLAGFGGDEDPALRHATVRRRVLVRAVACCEARLCGR
jgi:hypothetical protein